MMYKLLTVPGLYLLTIITASAQAVETNITYTTSISGANGRFIVYDPKQKLAIESFKGNPDAGSTAVAITSSGFLFKAGFRNTAGKAVLNILVDCNFDRQLSWMKEKGKNEYILEHEQHHFDISYISTLLFMKKVRQTSFTVDNYKEELQTIYDDAIHYMEQLQAKYDSETGNGVSKAVQEAWSKKIDTQLASLISEL